jgi:hypothetical protein
MTSRSVAGFGWLPRIKIYAKVHLPVSKVVVIGGHSQREKRCRVFYLDANKGVWLCAVRDIAQEAVQPHKVLFK